MFIFWKVILLGWLHNFFILVVPSIPSKTLWVDSLLRFCLLWFPVCSKRECVESLRSQLRVSGFNNICKLSMVNIDLEFRCFSFRWKTETITRYRNFDRAFCPFIVEGKMSWDQGFTGRTVSIQCSHFFCSVKPNEIFGIKFRGENDIVNKWIHFRDWFCVWRAVGPSHEQESGSVFEWCKRIFFSHNWAGTRWLIKSRWWVESEIRRVGDIRQRIEFVRSYAWFSIWVFTENTKGIWLGSKNIAFVG